MKHIELCMKYDTCRRCPSNKLCEEEYQNQQESNKADEGYSDTKDLDGD